MPLFKTVSQDQLCSEIDSAKERVILAAPGVTLAIADALIDAGRRLSRGDVRIVLDVSPSVARLGYGDHSAVERLLKAGLTVHQQPGLRIGVLVCDEAGWCFSTSPRLVEADPVTGSDAFNAVGLTSAQVLVLCAELPSVQSHADKGLAPEYPVVGADVVSDETVEKVKTALELAPPQPFDLARQAQVYSALIQFVELTFEGFDIQSKRVKMPSSLPLLATRDRGLRERLAATLKILDKIEKPAELKTITARLEELRKAYLIPVGKPGRIILKSKRKEFERELNEIGGMLSECKSRVKAQLDNILSGAVENLVPELSRAVVADPPPIFRGRYPATISAAEQYVRDELANVFPTSDELVEGMKIHRYYKDVTYETLKDERFRHLIEQEVPRSILQGSLLNEFVAAKSQAPTREL
jgi:hypothetical protein